MVFKQTVLELSSYLDIHLYPYGNAKVRIGHKFHFTKAMITKCIFLSAHFSDVLNFMKDLRSEMSPKKIFVASSKLCQA